MKIAVLGAGKQARGVIEYLYRAYWKSVNVSSQPQVTVADAKLEAAQELRDQYPEMRLAAVAFDASAYGQVVDLLKDKDVAISCLPYYLNGELTLAAINASCNFCDLGGNNDIVAQQLKYNELAKQAGVTVIPDCGLAPGFVSILTSEAVHEGFTDIKIRVGGLPVRPVGLLEYGNYFSVEGLINEYVEPVKVLLKGKIETIEPLTQYERIEIFGRELEAFSTSGGISTLPQSFVNDPSISISYKTLRYPGHHRIIRSLFQLGQLTTSNIKKLIDLDEKTREQSRYPGALDIVYAQVVANSFVPAKTRVYEIAMRSEPSMSNYAPSITAMMKATAFPAAIVMTLLPDLTDGVRTQEDVINPGTFRQRLRDAGLMLHIKETTMLE